MQYYAPTGAATPNDPYVGKNVTAGTQGSKVPPHAVEHPMRELVNLLTYAEGVRPGAVGAPSPADLQQVLKAILALLGWAASTVPIHCEFTTNNGLPLFDIAPGQLVLDMGNHWVHRGINKFDASAMSISDRTLSTVAGKTYHGRWHAPGTGQAVPLSSFPNGKVLLQDLSSAAYNPLNLAENDPSFDGTPDDVLLCKAVTNGSNVLTAITPLLNKARLSYSGSSSGTPVNTNSNAEYQYPAAVFTNWARKPAVSACVGYVGCPGFTTAGYLEGAASRIDKYNVDRYNTQATALSDWTINTVPYQPYGKVWFDLYA